MCEVGSDFSHFESDGSGLAAVMCLVELGERYRPEIHSKKSAMQLDSAVVARSLFESLS